MKYSDDWNARSIKLKKLDLAIAPEIFVAPERLYLPTGRVILKDTKYFTWATAQELVVNGYVPQGWRLPTMEEGAKISRCRNGGRLGASALGLDGLISPGGMIAYSYNVKLEKTLVIQRGQAGYYWTSDLESPLYPYVISNGDVTIRCNSSVYATYGLPLLLVKSM